MEMWSGAILEDGRPIVEDLHFSSSGSTTSPALVPSGTQLEYLAVVDPGQIPLHLAAGPSLLVWTDNDHTEAWFSDFFLGSSVPNDPDNEPESPWRDAGRAQSSVGLLLKVPPSESRPMSGSSARMTEVLVYATVSTTNPPCALATPPASSSPSASPGRTYPREAISRQAAIYALPLSSHLLYKGTAGATEAQLAEQPPSAAHFLSPPCEDQDAITIQAALKRRRTDSLFSDAVERKKAAKRRGSQRVSLVASAQPESHAPSLPQLPRPAPSRSPSLPPAQDAPLNRPRSRYGPTSDAHRSSLSRVASTSDLPTAAIEPSPVEAQNKDALSKIVMAGLRIYGLQQKRACKASVSDATADEYKLVYHQAFKGACFALRRQLGGRVLRQQEMRETVDKLLALFCTDPLAVGSGGEGKGTLGFGVEGAEQNPFLVGAVAVVSTPRVRKRYRDGDGESESQGGW